MLHSSIRIFRETNGIIRDNPAVHGDIGYANMLPFYARACVRTASLSRNNI